MLLFFRFRSTDKGIIFSKKQYTEESLPTFAESKHLLPVPVLEGKNQWVDLYWKAWEIAFSRLQKPPKGSPFVSNWIDEALSPQIFQWDTNFMTMFGRYGHHIFPFINSHDNFYCRQHDDGMICRVINEADGSDHYWGMGKDFSRTINPPLYSWAEVENYKVTGDKSRFAMILPVLEKYAEWIESHKKGTDTPHQLYWSNGQACGMDNTPRDIGRPQPGDGANIHSAIDHVGWVDMSAQMVIFYKDLAYICSELNEVGKAENYTDKANEIANRINKWLWDDSQGIYFDVNPEGVKNKWITIATFWPMFARITDKEQNEKLVANLKNPKLFWTRIPVPSLAANQEYYDINGKYWRGGVWAPTNYMVVQGLVKNGYESEANEIATKYLDAIYNVFKESKTLWETYSPEMYIPATNASGIYLCQSDFVGWTGLGPISMLIENIIGIRVNAPENIIEWHITNKSSHGLKNLHCNGSIVNLMASYKEDRLSLEVSSEKDMTLKVFYKGEIHSYNLSNQIQSIEI